MVGGLELGDHMVGRNILIYIKDVNDPRGKKRKLEARSWSAVRDLKDALQKLLHVNVAKQRLFFHGRELQNRATLQDCGIFEDGETLLFAIQQPHGKGERFFFWNNKPNLSRFDLLCIILTT